MIDMVRILALSITVGFIVGGGFYILMSPTPSPRPAALELHDREVISMTKFCTEYYKWEEAQQTHVEGMAKHCEKYK